MVTAFFSIYIVYVVLTVVNVPSILLFWTVLAENVFKRHKDGVGKLKQLKIVGTVLFCDRQDNNWYY